MPFIEEMRSEGEPLVRLGYFIVDADEMMSDVLSAAWLFFDLDMRNLITEAHRAMAERVLAGREPSEILPAFYERRRPEFLEPEEALAREGLTGRELTAKLEGYSKARMVLHRGGGLRNLRRAWRWMKAILQSLAGVFPPAAAILEIADLIENGAEDVEEFATSGAW